MGTGLVTELTMSKEPEQKVWGGLPAAKNWRGRVAPQSLVEPNRSYIT